MRARLETLTRTAICTDCGKKLPKGTIVRLFGRDAYCIKDHADSNTPKGAGTIPTQPTNAHPAVAKRRAEPKKSFPTLPPLPSYNEGLENVMMRINKKRFR